MATRREESGKKLQNFRIAKGFTEKEYAEKIGTTVSRLKRFENGEVPIPITFFFKMCKVLELTEDEINNI